MANENKPKKVDIKELNAFQLNALRQQLEQETEILGQSIERMMFIRQKLRDSKECIQKHKDIAAGTEVLVPVTGSMYLNGTVEDTNSFLIDIGTGYYVEKDATNSIDFFERKIINATKDIENLTKQIEGKVKLCDTIYETLQFRQQDQQQAVNN